MPQYTSCFVGVPLPDKFQKKFEDLLVKIKKLNPNWEIVYPKTPHITIYYLDKQSQYVIPIIKNVVEKESGFLRKEILTVKSFDYFAQNDAREGIIFLKMFTFACTKSILVCPGFWLAPAVITTISAFSQPSNPAA